MEVTEAPSVHRATEIVCQFYQQFIYKAFTPKQLSRICTLYLCRSLCRRHLCDIAFTSVLSVVPCAYYIRLLVYHSIFRKNRKNKMYHNSKNTSKLLLPRTSPPQNTLFLTFIPISLIIYNKRNIQNESSCHSCHKRIAYNLLICSIFA